MNEQLPNPSPVPANTEPAAATESFADMFAQSDVKKPKKLSPGDRVRAKVVTVGQRHLVLDVGHGLDGLLDSAEVVGQDIKAGDTLDVFVRRSDGRNVELVRVLGGRTAGNSRDAAKGGREAADDKRQLLEEAFKAQVPVEGTIKEVNKGGFVVDIGGARAFCPMGQLELRRFEDPTPFIGKAFQFLVTEIKDRRDAVVSRRKLLEADQEAKARVTRESLKVGAKVSGTVVNIKDFGAFIDLGGVEALVPVSEMAYSRTNKVSDVVSLGQVIEGEIIKMEPGAEGKRERITVSLRALLPAPEKPAAPDQGKILEVTVDRIETFGLFVKWDTGRGLVPVSELGQQARGADLRKTYPIGSKFQAVVTDVQPDGKVRLSKTEVALREERAETAAFMGNAAKSKSFGTFADLLKKK